MNDRFVQLNEIVEVLDEVAYDFELLLETFEASMDRDMRTQYNEALHQTRKLQGYIERFTRRQR